MATAPTPSAPSARRRMASWAVLLVLAACMIYRIADSGEDTGTPPRPSAAQAPSSDSAPVREAASSVASLPESAPVRIKIPSISVDAPVQGLSRNEDGGLNAPPADDTNLAGWDAAGIPPGSTGTAVMAGHVDTRTGPAVFYGLGSLKKGATVTVSRQDGSTAQFTVDGVQEYEKANFPSRKVYAQQPRPELRLITCGGTYTTTDGYSGNVVVYAHLTGTD
ncbi:class F sortase [Streptomyces sp. SID14478]|uniref:class F sortase n=1 Tax=Streptomyces sp. SID14478 TaxID=2706073 RepID=UPI0013DC8093|nr:class F sortase [Streptomyces sp. SID14478]NEB76993.1 class F sortase [Streptomyces sp. SID14478]